MGMLAEEKWRRAILDYYERTFNQQADDSRGGRSSQDSSEE